MAIGPLNHNQLPLAAALSRRRSSEITANFDLGRLLERQTRSLLFAVLWHLDNGFLDRCSHVDLENACFGSMCSAQTDSLS